MKLFSFLAIFALAFTAAARAGEAGDFLSHPGKLIAEPDLKTPLEAPWKIAKGKWEAVDGVLTGTQIPEEKHTAVLWHLISPASVVVECEFQFDGKNGFLVGCDGAKHIGRVVINPKGAKISEDSTEVKGSHPGATLAEAKLDLKKDQWYPVLFGWKDDKIFAIVDGQELVGQHPSFTAKRSRWWFAGPSERIRKIRVSEGQP